MVTRESQHDSSTCYHLDPKKVSPNELVEMQKLYSHDATEAHIALFDDKETQAVLREHFEAKANSLLDTLLDPNQKFWVAKHDGHIVGMAGYSRTRRLIHSVYISTESRGHGLGHDLMLRVLRDTTEETARGQRTILVASANVRAIKFYERLGFKATGDTKEWKIEPISIPESEMTI
jgi:ribosomal protein S18 acetylase RimI-like enzyme